jgi:hypothetical protein
MCIHPYIHSYNQLHIINEDGVRTMFQNSRGSSNIDLTIGNNQMLATVKDWEISEESCSNHNIIKFNLSFACDKAQIYNFLGTQYITKEQQHPDFHKNLLQSISKNFLIENEGNTNEIDGKLNTVLTGQKGIGIFIEKFNQTIQSTCKKTFKLSKSSNTTAK